MGAFQGEKACVNVMATYKKISNDERLMYKELFVRLDEDQSGSVSVEEMELLLPFLALSNVSTHADLVNTFADVDEDGKGEIEVKAFIVMMHRGRGGAVIFHEGLIPKVEAQTSELTYREWVWKVFDRPSESTLGSVVAGVVMFIIVLSVVAFCLETVEPFATNNKKMLSGAETFFVIVFTVEYVLRFWSSPSRLQFCLDVMNFFDLLAILPWYLVLVLEQIDSENSSNIGNTEFFRTVRLIRVVRIFKFSRYLTWLKLLSTVLSESKAPLAMALFVMFIATVLFASVLFYLEKGHFDKSLNAWGTWTDDGTIFIEAPFQSIPAATYQIIITVTSVGYGTPLLRSNSKTILIGVMLLGVILLAIPISVFSSNFRAAYVDMLKKKLEEEQDRLERSESERSPYKHPQFDPEAGSYKKRESYKTKYSASAQVVPSENLPSASAPPSSPSKLKSGRRSSKGLRSTLMRQTTTELLAKHSDNMDRLIQSLENIEGKRHINVRSEHLVSELHKEVKLILQRRYRLLCSDIRKLERKHRAELEEELKHRFYKWFQMEESEATERIQKIFRGFLTRRRLNKAMAKMDVIKAMRSFDDKPGKGKVEENPKEEDTLNKPLGRHTRIPDFDEN